jgi:trans-aconitate methyltransferase
MSAEAFFNLHRDLPREGPGEAEDVFWAGKQIDLPEAARICDAGCGPGADIGALLSLAEQTTLVAIDRQPHFIEQASAHWGSDARVDLRCGDMADLDGPYDLIWCAGAAYLLGITEALQMWRAALAPGGCVAFSEPCWWAEPPSIAAQLAWTGYAEMSAADGIDARVRAAGYETVAVRRLEATAWDAYYRPMQVRIAGLRADADPTLAVILRDAENEIAAWRAHGDEFGYLLSVVRPL